LVGRAIVAAFGPVSTVAYVPDSFGHPAQFPQLFAGFGLDPFVSWRGNGTELDTLGPIYRWRAPDGSSVRAWHLGEGYFGAAGLDVDADVDTTVGRLLPVVERLASAGTGPVLLMNGFDHLPPDTSTASIAAALARATGTPVRRCLLDDAGASLPAAETLATWEGELAGARVTNLLPGVWSARLPLKLRNRTIETLLTCWAEPWSAFAHALGLADERPALRRAWQSLLCNQAHDSIGGCSIDAVHERMIARYDDAQGLATATVDRALERLAGRAPTRPSPWSDTQDVVVFNPSPHPRSGVVRVALDGYPPWLASVTRFDMHPLALADFQGLTLDGEPARVVPSDDPTRVRFLEGVGGLDLEFVARDVPAFGCRRYRAEPADAVGDDRDDGRTIAVDELEVTANEDGSLRVTLGTRTWDGLFAVEDCVDRGDSYDCDPDPPRALRLTRVEIARTRHPCGIQRLRVTRVLDEIGSLTVEATLAGGVPVASCRVTLDNAATDHRLRLVFPTGAPVATFDAATTFDVAHRSTTPPDDSGWVHGAPRTFPQQGWIAANGLVVGAPGLPEAEVTATGDILVTLVRSVGKLARLTLRTRPMPAGPEMPAPGAQVLGRVDAHVALATSASDARDAELGLRGVLGGPTPLLESGASLLQLVAARSELSTCKPAEDGDGIVARVLNPSDRGEDVVLGFGIDVASAHAVHLDESPAPEHAGVEVQRRSIRLPVPPHSLRSVRVRLAPPASAMPASRP
jgi:alpha-mannosidase